MLFVSMLNYFLYSCPFRRVFSLSISRLKSVHSCGILQFKRFSHNNVYLVNLLKSEEVKKLFEKLQNDGTFLREYSLSIKNLEVEKFVSNRREINESISSLLDLEKARTENDVELKNMLIAELKELKHKLIQVECQLLDAVTPKLPSSNEVILEISAGVGGQEAMLFAKCLYEMYCGYINYKNWSISTAEIAYSDLGGLRHVSLFIQGGDAFTYLIQESGVHRVQRVPTTERSGRIHTSTVAVAVLSQPKEIDVNLNLKDVIIETKRASGAGGQHVNKTESAVRITHLPTGISVECQTDRSQIKNKEIAFQKLCAKLMAKQQNEQSISAQLSRKLQMGSSSRSDKVRTYNYPQDRITDHRILRTLHNIPVFLEGGDMLDSLITDLILESEKNRYGQFISSLKEMNGAKC